MKKNSTFVCSKYLLIVREGKVKFKAVFEGVRVVQPHRASKYISFYIFWGLKFTFNIKVLTIYEIKF